MDELPKLNEEIAQLAKKLGEATALYGKISKNIECLPVLRHVIGNGNTTVYEYIHHEAPLSIEEPPIQIKLTIDENMSAGVSNTVCDSLRLFCVCANEL